MISALSRQSDLNRFTAHLLHNLVLELTRLNLEVQELKTATCSFQGVSDAGTASQTLEDMVRERDAAGEAPRRAVRASRAVRVRQLLAALSYGDAIGNEPLAIQRQLRAAGHGRTSSPARPPASPPGAPALVPAGLVSRHHLHLPLLDRQRRRRLIHHAPDRLVVVYHDIAGALLPRLSPAPRGLCHHGRRSSRLSPAHRARARRQRVQPQELEAAGSARTASLPIVLDLSLCERPPSPLVQHQYDDAAPTCCSSAASSRTRRSTTYVRSFAFFQKFVPPAVASCSSTTTGFERYFDRCKPLRGSAWTASSSPAGRRRRLYAYGSRNVSLCSLGARASACRSQDDALGLPISPTTQRVRERYTSSGCC